MKEDRVFGYGLCHQCGRKQPFMKGDVVRFRCDRCERVYELVWELTHELHLMNRRIDKHTLWGREFDRFDRRKLMKALIGGATKWYSTK